MLSGTGYPSGENYPAGTGMELFFYPHAGTGNPTGKILRVRVRVRVSTTRRVRTRCHLEAEQTTERPRHQAHTYAVRSGVPCRLVFPLAFSSPREVAEHPTQHACLPSSRSSLPSPSSSSSSPPSPSSSSSSEESAPAAGPQFGRDPSIRFDLPRVWLGNLNAGESVITVEGHDITLPGHHRKFWQN